MCKNCKTTSKIGLVITLILAIYIIFAGILTITSGDEKFVILGLLEFQTLIGLGKIIIGLLLLWPKTFRFALLLFLSFWGGVIVTHMAQGFSILMPILFLAGTWLIIILRAPSMIGVCCKCKKENCKGCKAGKCNAEECGCGESRCGTCRCKEEKTEM